MTLKSEGQRAMVSADISARVLVPIVAGSLSALAHIRHGFFTREGGTSTGIFASLNCGVGSSDDTASVMENRARVARSLGAHKDDVLTIYQVHGAEAVVMDTWVERPSRPRADALVSATPGLAIGVLTADCAPVLFADTSRGIVAAAHAGWRGAVAGVTDAAIAAMERLGAERQHIRAVVGPCIGFAAYEVGQDFVAEVLDRDPSSGAYFGPVPGSKQPHFDLPRYLENRLLKMGLKSVSIIPLCTYENESLFFSYRRSVHRNEPDYGRQISVIVAI